MGKSFEFLQQKYNLRSTAWYYTYMKIFGVDKNKF